MTATVTKYEELLTALSNCDLDDWGFSKIRSMAWEKIQQLAAPLQENLDLYNAISVPSYDLQKIEFENHRGDIFPECSQSFLVFANGHYRHDLSNVSGLPKQVVVSPLDAGTSYSTFFGNYMRKSIKTEEDQFTLINSMLQRGGVFLYVPSNIKVKLPIQVINIVDSKSAMASPFMLLSAGPHSEVSIFSSISSSSDLETTVNGAYHFSLEDSARVHYTSVPCYKSPRLSHFDNVRAYQKKNSFFRSLAITKGSSLSRHCCKIALDGENSDGEAFGCWSLAEDNKIFTDIAVDHKAPHCRSRQHFKGIVDDSSKALFNGEIFVQHEAQKTDAFQLNNNLILSDDAIANSKPNLRIFADDVKASHGSTTSALDPKQLLYLKTRGLNTAAAQKLLVSAFSKEILDLITLDSARLAMLEIF